VHGPPFFILEIKPMGKDACNRLRLETWIVEIPHVEDKGSDIAGSQVAGAV